MQAGYPKVSAQHAKRVGARLRAMGNISSAVVVRWLAAGGVEGRAGRDADIRHDVQEVVVDGDVEMARVVVTGTLTASSVGSRAQDAAFG